MIKSTPTVPFLCVVYLSASLNILSKLQ
jgi:hypothetical protein